MTIISNSQRYIFIHPHKTGGTSVEYALAEGMKWNDILLGSTPLGERNQVVYREMYGLFKHSSASQIKSTVGEMVWQEYWKFSVVRNPFTRMLSLYTWTGQVIKKWGRTWPSRSKFRLKCLLYHKHPALRPYLLKDGGDSRTPPFTWKPVQAYLGSGSFSDFLRRVLEQIKDIPAVQPQATFLSTDDGVIELDYIMRLEHIQEDWKAVCSRFGTNPELPHLNSSSASLRRLKDWYRASDIQLMLEAYEQDMSTFGYDVPA